MTWEGGCTSPGGTCGCQVFILFWASHQLPPSFQPGGVSTKERLMSLTAGPPSPPICQTSAPSFLGLMAPLLPSPALWHLAACTLVQLLLGLLLLLMLLSLWLPQHPLPFPQHLIVMPFQSPTIFLPPQQHLAAHVLVLTLLMLPVGGRPSSLRPFLSTMRKNFPLFPPPHGHSK